ncbi:hypothetical protein MMC16_005789 [Acarospora aff. strigata]|nr:hypothetical protein [Acarospora aff. strigata]
MRSPRGWPAPSLMMWFLLLLGFIVSAAVAQGDLPTLTGSTNNAIPTASSPPATSPSSDSAAAAASSKTDQASSPSPAASTSPSSAASSSPTQPTSSRQTPPPKVSPSTPSAAQETGGLPSGLPALPGGFNYPAPTVPPTQNAPYMQKSNLPEGTVFIAVGAVLAFLGLGVLAWRGLVAWSLHRSVKRAAMQQHYGDTKSKLRGPGGGFYSHGPGSTLSLEQLGASGRTNTARSKSQTSKGGNLFFSPTAGAGMHAPGNRGSSYLPAGYYAAGNSAPGGGSGMTHVGSGPISLSNLGPQSYGYSRARSLGPSPPGSPALPPSRGGDVGYGRGSTVGLSTHASTSTLNLSAPPQGRAPSAYLEDLFENYPPVPTGLPSTSTDRRH